MKNNADALFFARLFVPERHKRALMAEQKLHSHISVRPVTKRSGMEAKMNDLINLSFGKFVLRQTCGVYQ